MSKTQLVTSSHKVDWACLGVPEDVSVPADQGSAAFVAVQFYPRQNIANIFFSFTTDLQMPRTFTYAHEEAVVLAVAYFSGGFTSPFGLRTV